MKFEKMIIRHHLLLTMVVLTILIGMGSITPSVFASEDNKLTLDLLPSSVYAGDTIIFSGRLVTVSGEPISGVTIFIKDDDFGPDDLISTTTTNTDGYYNISVIVKDWDNYGGDSDIYAVFEGDNYFTKARTPNQKVTVYEEQLEGTEIIVEKLVLTLDTLPSEIKEGQMITFSGRLVTESGKAVPNVTINIKDDDTAGKDDLISTTTTNSNGYYNIQVAAKDWDSSSGGASEIYAIFEGNTSYEKIDTLRQKVTVFQTFEKNPTELVLDNFTLKSALVGDVVTFTGTITSYGNSVSGVVIQIKEDDPFVTDEFLASGKTDSRGEFLIQWNVAESGIIEKEFDIYAVFQGDDEYRKVKSPNQPLSIYKIQTWITLDSIPTVATIGEQFSFTGNIKFEKGSTQGAVIYIKDEDPFGFDDLLATGFADATGQFLVNWIVRPVDENNIAEIYAVFQGDKTFSKSTTCGKGCTETIPLKITDVPTTPPQTPTVPTTPPQTPTVPTVPTTPKLEPPTILFRPDAVVPGEYMKYFFVHDFSKNPKVMVVVDPDSYNKLKKYIVPVQEGILLWKDGLDSKVGGNWDVDIAILQKDSAFSSTVPDIIINIVSPETENSCSDVFGAAYIWKRPVNAFVCGIMDDGERSNVGVSRTSAHEFIHTMGLGHTFNKAKDMMCSVEDGKATCPGSYSNKENSPSEFSLAAVVGSYGFDGYQNPNYYMQTNSKFTLMNFDDIFPNGDISNTVKPTTITPQPTTITPQPTITQQAANKCGPGTILENGICVLDEQIVIEEKQEKDMFARFLDLLKFLFS